MVVQAQDNWTLAYSAVPGIPPGVLHNLARMAGVHLYAAAGDALYAGQGRIVLHARTAGQTAVRLPGRYDAQEILGQGRQWRQTERVEVLLAAKETVVLALSEP